MRGTFFSEHEMYDVDWLMDDWFPMGELSMLVGGPGTGKDIFGWALMAAITRGWPMPDGTPAVAPASCIHINTEDKVTTTKPRGIAAGADESMISDMSKATRGNYRNKFSIGKAPDDLSLLRREIKDLGDCRFAWVSVMNSVATVNSRNGLIARDKIIEPLQDVAEDTGVHICLVHHYVKDGTIGGSQQIEDALRVIIKIRRDQANEDIRVVSSYKNTNARTDVPPLRYVIEGERPFSRARFLPPGELEAPTADRGEPRPGTGMHAVLWALRDAQGDPGLPMSPQAISAETDIPHHSVRVYLNRLRDKGLVSQPPRTRGIYQAAAVTNGADLRRRDSAAVTNGQPVTNGWASPR